MYFITQHLIYCGGGCFLRNKHTQVGVVITYDSVVYKLF